MNNKTNIEEDITICEHIVKNFEDMRKYSLPPHKFTINSIDCNAIENLLVDRERLEKENEELTRDNFKLNTKLENNRKEYQETYKDVREELKELQAKANKYDSLVEKIKEKMKELKENKNHKYTAGTAVVTVNELQKLLDGFINSLEE